jgi:hypothetical protein
VFVGVGVGVGVGHEPSNELVIPPVSREPDHMDGFDVG